jgi:hypothetical protein
MTIFLQPWQVKSTRGYNYEDVIEIRYGVQVDLTISCGVDSPYAL